MSMRLKTGTRVRLRAPAPGLKLRSDTGTVVRPDEWLGYYIVHLDQPAYYEHTQGNLEVLEDICEAEDNLEVLPTDGGSVSY